MNELLLDQESLTAVPSAAADMTADSATLSASPAAALTAAALMLAACGGGGGSSSGSSGPQVAAPTGPPPPTPADMGRFLGQSAMGANRAEVDRVLSIGIPAWIDEQIAMARPTSHWNWLVANGFNVIANQGNTAGFDPAMWQQFISSPDQLRQRVGLALLDFIVVSIDQVGGSWRQFAMAAFIDILWDNAFGNFRTLLEKISTNAAMAQFLTFLGNNKANTQRGTIPDENYARELMQLFALGPQKLNSDGSVQMEGDRAAETYTQDDVSGLARVFTGWNLDSTDNTIPDRYGRPLVPNANQHEMGVKTFLGTTIPAGTAGADSLRLALDAIFAHANCPPFVSKTLIQRLVTSNPSPAYIARVSAKFENDGAGVRGNLAAVVKAILLDDEARSKTAMASANAGKLREPVTRLTGWARAFGVTSPSGAWAIGDTSNPTNRLGQGAGHAPSVFNFFRPGYAPPNSSLATQKMVAPEMQITNEPSVFGYLNYMMGLIQNGTGDVKAEYTDWLTRTATSASLVNDINIVLAGGQVNATTVAQIVQAVDSIDNTTLTGPNNRLYTAIMLVMASPEYLVLK
ncbi:DUF1800 family protein [Sphingoaurantiacus capsulatus]|uniref:DUF1800 family protein n=1 Tax=Sphingoaurantiacus capsulatus TaxID=1771310 RepID=A0ABV7XDC2_9SPHN